MFILNNTGIIRNYLEKSAFYLHESHIYDTDRLQMCYSGRLTCRGFLVDNFIRNE